MAKSRGGAGKFLTRELAGTRWQTPVIYQELEVLPAGAFGQVCSASDTRDGSKVVLKKLSQPFQTPTLAKRTYRELKLLMHMSHENVISLLDCFSPDVSQENFKDLYMVTELMGCDLGQILQTQHLSLEQTEFVTYQIFRGLKYIHSAGIIHRDLKPANIAVAEDCSVKIIDFGLARSAVNESMTGYVATRWYRAPEIITNWMHYSQTVDVWSVGCILSEMLTHQPLFPGIDHIDQLKRILMVVGTPSVDFVEKIENMPVRRFLQDLPKYPRRPFNAVPAITLAGDSAVYLMEKIFVLKGEDRITVDECLNSDFFSNFHDPDDEPVAEPFVDKMMDDDDASGSDTSVDVWRGLVLESVVKWRKENPY